MPRSTIFATLLLAATAAGCGGGNDNCYWDRRCESVNGELTCVWVKVCPQAAAATVGSLRTASTVYAESGERWDVQSGTATVIDGGTNALAVRLLGEEAARRIDGEHYRRWWFHGWPANDVRRAAAALPDGAVEQIHVSAGEGVADAPGCDALTSVHTGALMPLPRAVFLRDPILVYSPVASELVPSSRNLGLVVQLMAPGEEGARTRCLSEGETARISLDTVGRWRVRVILLTQDLRDLGAADAVVVQEADVEVVASR